MNALQDLRGWISQSVKRLPQKHKDMSSIPGIQAEPLNVVVWACNPQCWGGRDRKSLQGQPAYPSGFINFLV